MMAKNQTVTIVPAESGALVRAYANSPEHGYVHLQTVSMAVINGWVQESKRSHLLKGTVKVLQNFIAGKSELEGNIVICECYEDEIPAQFMSALNLKDFTLEEAIQPFLKRAGKDGPVLTKDGKRILRFTDYDPSGKVADTFKPHDPVQE